MEGEPAPDDGVVAFDQRSQNERRQRRSALDVGAADGCVGLDEKVAHLPGPLLFVDVDQGLEFAQVMGVAQRVPDAGQRAIGFEVIVDDHPATKALGQRASLGRHPIRGQGDRRGGMQPMAFAGDAKARFVTWRTPARATSSQIRAATTWSSSAFFLPQATTLSGHSLIAPNRSAMVCATRSSGMSC